MAAITTELISVLVGAASGGGVSYLIHRQDVSHQRTDKLREVLIKILELREEAGRVRRASRSSRCSTSSGSCISLWLRASPPVRRVR